MRASHLLALLAAALFTALAGCGGGGGGGSTGGGGVVTTTAIIGRVVDMDGNGIVGASLQATTGADRAILTTTTGDGGQYTLSGIPVGTDFDLAVTIGGNPTTSYQGLRVGAPINGFSPMDVVVAPDAPPVGSTISITPPGTTVTVATLPSYSVRLDQGNGIILSGYPAVWTVSGAEGFLSGGGLYYAVVPGAVGSRITLRAMVRLENGHVIFAERTMTVVSPGGDDDNPPDPPG